MDDNVFHQISANDFDLEPEMDPVHATYRETRIPLTGEVSLAFSPSSIRATIVDHNHWQEEMLRTSGSSLFSFGAMSLFRDVLPGIMSSSAAGSIVSESGGWEARDALICGVNADFASGEASYTFHVGEISIQGPSFGSPVAASRHLFGGGNWNATSRFNGNRLVVRGLRSGSRRDEEILSATVEGDIDDIATQALWLMLSFITGNRLASIAIEKYASDGRLVETIHRRGGEISVGRYEYFHPYYAPLTASGIEAIGSGILRLMRAADPFPIEMLIHHLLDGNTSYLETDAQHRVLSIHTAIEAWNRKYGITEWIDSSLWKPFADKSRRHVFAEIRDTVGPHMRTNLASAYVHANQTTTADRQRWLFEALDIQLDEDDRRSLNLRNELLHSGYFLRRFHQLSPAEQQLRRDDTERLRRLAAVVILRLCAFEGTIVDGVRFTPYQITRVNLPTDIAPSNQLTETPSGSSSPEAS